MAACHAAKEGVWLKQLFENWVIHMERLPFTLDSKSGLALIRNPVFRKRTKHILIQWHFVRDLVEQGILDFEFVGTKGQATDILD